MDKKQTNDSRDRVVYDYLESLDRGDIDGIIDSLQQALYDPLLDQMIVDAHQSYFQEEPIAPTALTEQDTQQTLTIEPIVRLPRGAGRRQKKDKRVRYMARWVQVLAAILIFGILMGSFLAIQALHSQSLGNKHGGPPVPVCQPYPLKQVDAPNNIPTEYSLNSLTSIATISENDAWAVGSSHSAPEVTVTPPKNTFTEHWDGKSWSFVHSPNGSDYNSQLNGVAAVSTNDVWAVGASFPDSGFEPIINTGGISPTFKPLIEHWDGKKWQVVPSANIARGYGSLSAITAISQHDIWAVGAFYDAKAEATIHPLLEHWDGISWHVIAPPGGDTASMGILNDVTAISANDVWVAGHVSVTDSKPSQGLIMHWDGHQWNTETSPMAYQISNISVLSAHDIWIDGMDLASNNYNLLVEHWDGKKWSTVGVPSQFLNSNALISNTTLNVTAVADNDVWAVGNTRKNGIVSQTLILHWNGKSWQHVPTPTLQSFSAATDDAAAKAVAYGGQLWILVNTSDGHKQYDMSLILGQRTCP
jgi:hypothetical protein